MVFVTVYTISNPENGEFLTTKDISDDQFTTLKRSIERFNGEIWMTRYHQNQTVALEVGIMNKNFQLGPTDIIQQFIEMIEQMDEDEKEDEERLRKKRLYKKALVNTIRESRFGKFIVGSSMTNKFNANVKYSHGRIITQSWKDEFTTSLKNNGFDGKVVFSEQSKEEADIASRLQQQQEST
jgi:hypothetical protein